MCITYNQLLFEQNHSVMNKETQHFFQYYKSMFVSTQRFPSAGTKPLVKNGRQMDRAKYWKYSERFLIKYLFLNEKKKFVMLKGGRGGGGISYIQSCSHC